MSRSRWLVGRVAVASGLVVAIGVLCGAGSRLGSAAQGGAVGLGELLAAGLNLAPPAILVLGTGVLAFGLRPGSLQWWRTRVVGWPYLVQLVATFVGSNRLLLDSSVLAHIAPAPAAQSNWTSACGLVGLGLLTSALGVLAFRRRDLASE